MNKLLKEVELYIEKNYYTSSYVCKATFDDFYIDFMGIVKKTFSEVLSSIVSKIKYLKNSNLSSFINILVCVVTFLISFVVAYILASNDGFFLF